MGLLLVPPMAEPLATSLTVALSCRCRQGYGPNTPQSTPWLYLGGRLPVAGPVELPGHGLTGLTVVLLPTALPGPLR